MKKISKGTGWDVVMAPALFVVLDCGHWAEVPVSWVMPDGKLSCGLTCATCPRRTYDLVLDGWEAPNG